nr:hypothetical protein [Veillonella denticariosi]
MAEELNINVTGINLPPLKVEGTFTVPAINILGQNGKSAYELWLESGHSGTREDFINSLKGQDGRDGNNGLPGKDASAQGAYEMLMGGMNVYCENATLDEVLKGLIRGLGDVIKKPFKPLEFDRPERGQTYINVYGTPHFKAAILGKGAAFGVNIGDDGRGRLDLDKPFASDDIELEYFNMLGSIVGTYRISGYSGDKTTLSKGDVTDLNTTEINFPEVTTVEAESLSNLKEVSTIILPKVTRIGKNAFDENLPLNLMRIPLYVLDQDSPVLELIGFRIGAELYISEKSDVNALYSLWNKQNYYLKIYNGDGTKKFDPKTKTWVPVQ